MHRLANHSRSSNQELPTLTQIPQHEPFKHSQPRSFNSDHSDLSDPPSSLSDQDSPFATTAAARIRPVLTTSKPKTTIRRLIFTTTPREVNLQISRSKAIDEQALKPAFITHKKKVSVAGKKDAVGEKVKRSGPNNPTGKNQWSRLRDLEKEAGVEELSGDSRDSFKKPAPNPKGRKQHSAAQNPKDALTKRQEKLQRKENFEQRQLNNEEVAIRDIEHESPIQSVKEDIVPRFVSTRIHRNMAGDARRRTTRSTGMGDANMEDVMEHSIGLNANHESVQQETAQPSTRAPRPAVALSDIDDIADTGIDEGSINASQGENMHEPRAADEQADSDVEMMDIPPRSRSPTSTVSSSIVIQDKGAGGDRPKRARSHPEIFSELYSSSRSATADKSIVKQETDVKDDSRTKSMLAPGSIPWATSRHRVTTAAPLRFTPLCKVQQADIIEISESDVPNIPMLPGVPTTMTTPQSRAQLQYQQRTTNSASSSFSTNNMANTTVIDFAYVASAKAGTDTGTTPQQQALAEGQASQVEDVEDEEPLLKRARLDSAVVQVPPVLLAAEDDATHEEDPKISHPMIAASMQSQALSRPRSVTPVIPQLAHRQSHSPSSSPASLQSSLQLLRAASQGHQSQALPRPVYVQAIRTPPPPQRLNAPLKEDALALLRKEEFEMSCELLPDVATRTNRFSPALVNMGALIEHTVQGRKRTEADNITEQEPQADYDGVNIPMIPMVYPQSSNLELGDAMERLRRTSVATKILNDNRKEYGKASAEKDRASHTMPQGLKNTAIARLTMIKATEPQEVDIFGNHYQTRKHEHPYIDPVGDQCSFCNYVSDWGVTDSRVWLPIEAFPEFCTECNPDNHIQSSFFDSADFFSSSPSEPEPRPSDYVLESEKITERRIFGSDAEKKANNGRPAAGVTRVKDMHSSRDVTDFQAIQTCRAHPSRQVDCRKAHICTPCLKEKIGVLKHRKHEKFVPISRCEVVIDGQVVMGFNNPSERICMVCQNLAEVRCENCPLRLCSGCETRLNRLCKGFLNNLFYHYGGAHLRNDVSCGTMS